MDCDIGSTRQGDTCPFKGRGNAQDHVHFISQSFSHIFGLAMYFDITTT